MCGQLPESELFFLCAPRKGSQRSPHGQPWGSRRQARSVCGGATPHRRQPGWGRPEAEREDAVQAWKTLEETWDRTSSHKGCGKWSCPTGDPGPYSASRWEESGEITSSGGSQEILASLHVQKRPSLLGGHLAHQKPWSTLGDLQDSALQPGMHSRGKAARVCKTWGQLGRMAGWEEADKSLCLAWFHVVGFGQRWSSFHFSPFLLTLPWFLGMLEMLHTSMVARPVSVAIIWKAQSVAECVYF